MHELKIGDKVIVQSHWHKDVGTVVKVTPSGLVDVLKEGHPNPKRYNKHGQEQGATGYNIESLYTWTQELEDKIRDGKRATELKIELKNLNYDILCLDQLERIISIVHENK